MDKFEHSFGTQLGPVLLAIDACSLEPPNNRRQKKDILSRSCFGATKQQLQEAETRHFFLGIQTGR